MKWISVQIFTLCLLLPVLAQAQSPNAVVEEAVVILGQALTERRDELTQDSGALHALIDEILLPRFDRKYAAQLVLGKNWRSATPEQRNAFVDEFYASLLRRYADGLLKFDQHKIEVLAYRGDDSKKHTKVKTVVSLADGTKVPVDYALVKRDSGWLIIDVIIEGISYLQTTKKELNEEIRRSSLDAVIARLKRENAGES
jgi:phospholipid transport system substrate-binding protein